MKHKLQVLRRDFLKKMASIMVLTPVISFGRHGNGRDDDPLSKVKKLKKIDIHTHISSDALYLREIMERLNMKMFTICNEGLKTDRLDFQTKAAIEITDKYPRYYSWCTTFDLNRLKSPGWTDRTLDFLKHSFKKGALAVKVWKDVGMQLKDESGNFIQIDDPVFDPILNYIKKEGRTLFAHTGDPVDWWLSSGSDGFPDAWYKKDAGVWNRLGTFRGEVSYDKLMKARDNMLAKHPGLRVIGCHMGSMSFDVDVLSDRLDRFQDLAVETSFTTQYLKGQAREKVRTFFMDYQDRIIYGSDISGGMIATPFMVDMSKKDQKLTLDKVKKKREELLEQYQSDFIYYASDQEIPFNNYTIRGLDLPRNVLEKIFYHNAVKWVPGIDRSF